MLTRIIEVSLQNRFLVISLTVLMVCLGMIAAVRLPVDAVPDMTNVQVTVITDAGSLSPLEVERMISYPVESAMSGLPRIEELRSISRLGISVVTIVFKEGTDVYWARQRVAERIPTASARILPGYGIPELGPLATALGEILQFEVRGEGFTPTELRSILDWEIAPKLREVRGVTEVNSHGGLAKAFEIEPLPDRMASFGIGIAQLYRAVEQNQAFVGGGYVVHHGEQRFIRGHLALTCLDDLGQIVLTSVEKKTPILLKDVAEIRIGALPRQGIATRDGRGEVVTGMVMMLIGENSRATVHRVKQRLANIQSTLPQGVNIEIIYDRSQLIQRTLVTVFKNLVEGGTLVVVILLVMLGNLWAGLVTALAIPCSMMFATNMMQAFAVSASLMSLGAIDFGLIVDSSVIMIENCVHHFSLPNDGRSRIEVIRDAAVEVRKPTMFGELIIAVVFIPVLMLQGTEGKLFRPMAMTFLFALFGSLVLSLTFMPAMASVILSRGTRHQDNLLVRGLKGIYRPCLDWIMRYRFTTVAVAIFVFLASLPMASHLGGEFMPRLEEGDLLIEVQRLPSASLEGAVPLSTKIEQTLRTFPEVKTVFCKTGRPEIANDIMGVHETDVWVILHDRHSWKPRRSRDDLIEEMNEALSRDVTGAMFGFTQPIEMRVNELVAGVKSDVAVQVYGDDLQLLAKLGKEVESILSTVPGAADVKASAQANLSALTISPRRDAMARYGISPEQVVEVIRSIGGHPVGWIVEQRARFPLIVRFPESWRAEMTRLGQLPIASTTGEMIPLGEIAHLILEETPPSIEHEAARRRTTVAANVRGRDVASFVREAQQKVARQLALPAGMEIRWGGNFEHLTTATRRLLLIAPIVLLMIFVLLQTSFQSTRLALLIFLAIPMATSGGIFALAIRGLPFSISAGVGFIALFGVAVLNGLVWINAAEQLRVLGVPILEATRRTAVSRMRPVLMTALVASLGFLPMAISDGDGAEMQRPLANVVIGGLITATLLTLFVVPAIYPWFATSQE